MVPPWSLGCRRWPLGGSGGSLSLGLLGPLNEILEQHASKPVAEIMVGAVAACTGSLVAHPIEVAKLRIQLQGELLQPVADRSARVPPVYRNTVQAMYTIARYDGVLALYRGLLPNLAYQFLANGLRLGIFQMSDDLGLTSDGNLEPSITLTAVFGGLSGAIGAFFSSPLFLLKTHIQLHSASSAIAVGYQHGYRTARAALAQIYRTQGVWNGLWRATSTNMLRLSVGSALQLSTFTAFKTLLNTAVEGRERYFVVNTLLAAFLSGVTVAPPVAFLDGLRARLYAQPSNPSGEGIYYNGLRDCVIKVKQTEGLRALARGAGGAFFYIMTSSVVTLVTWEEIKGRRDKNRTQKQDLLVDYGII